MDAMISGFMIAKDVLKQGYPFVEAIVSALPICDEFLISDGYSTDGTYEVLNRISGLNSKVKVYRYRWPYKKSVTVLADVTNEVRNRCRYQHIFSVQANEIIHEQSVPFIKAIPRMFPNVTSFSFPYLQLLNNWKLSEEFRLRFAKNLPQIVAKGDAWTLGTSKAFDRTKKLTCIIKPYRISRYVSNGISLEYANSCYGLLSRAIYLPNPIFRYWSLFPKNFIEKCQGHSELFGMQEFQKSLDLLQLHVEDPETFWRLGSETLKQSGFNELHYPEFYSFVDRKDHPTIIQEFISNPNTDHYYVREEMLELLKNL